MAKMRLNESEFLDFCPSMKDEIKCSASDNREQ